MSASLQVLKPRYLSCVMSPLKRTRSPRTAQILWVPHSSRLRSHSTLSESFSSNRQAPAPMSPDPSPGPSRQM
jgi:hypothetical protein